jgi:biopolymer transport protein ExbD
MYKAPPKKLLGQEAIQTTSLADMMFLLLIFFIMTTTLMRVTGFRTDMPSGANKPQAQQEKTTTVSLHEGRILVNDKETTMDGLRTFLRGLHLEQKTGDGKVVVVDATDHVSYQHYFETLSIIQAAGGVAALMADTKEQGK